MFPNSWYVILDVTWVLLMVAIFIGAIQAFADSTRPSLVGRFFGDMWLNLDWGASILGFVLIFFFVIFSTRLDGLAERLGELPPEAPMRAEYMPSNATTLQRTRAVTKVRQYHVDLADVIEDLE